MLFFLLKRSYKLNKFKISNNWGWPLIFPHHSVVPNFCILSLAFKKMFLHPLFCLSSEEVHSMDLKDHTAIVRTEIVKLGKKGSSISMCRIQTEKATQLKTQQEGCQRGWPHSCKNVSWRHFPGVSLQQETGLALSCRSHQGHSASPSHHSLVEGLSTAVILTLSHYCIWSFVSPWA